MAKIRHISISNFRAFKKFEWHPTAGLNCLVGPGDSGKSTLLDAMDLALGPRQSKVFSDADFHMLNTDEPIRIEITVGDLSEPLKNYEKYNLFLRGYKSDDESIEDEPGDKLENVLTVCLQIDRDLDPVWSLFSERAAAQGRDRNLSWGDRVLLAGTRIGAVADYHLSWRKGAVLNRIGDESPNTASAIAEAKRAARKAFGEQTQPDLKDVLKAVSDTANTLGVPIEGDLQALLNAHSISLSGGTISVHDRNGLPLSSLGLGSSRLLVAGLLDEAKVGSNIILVDELEHGLEPHRIIRFLDAIGAKDSNQTTQCFVTSHSPVVLRELNAHQLFRLCPTEDEHLILNSNVDDDSQGTLRSYPEAFLAKSVILCEGATEVGFLRGFDQYYVSQGHNSIWSKGVTLLNTGGVSKLYKPASTLRGLKYRTASFRDDDVAPDLIAEAAFERNSGTVFKWGPDKKIEAAIIDAVDDSVFAKIMEAGKEIVGESIANEQIKSASGNENDFATIMNKATEGEISQEDKDWLITACTTKNNSWFKSVDRMENLARNVIAPSLDSMLPGFQKVVDSIFTWARDG